MKESAPATLRVPVPGWERLAAGGLMAWWVCGMLFSEGGMTAWWGKIRFNLSSIMGVWQDAIQAGSVEEFAQPGSALFAIGCEYACNLGVCLGIIWLIGAGLAVAGSRGGHPLRTVYWLSMLGLSLVGLGGIAAEGRIWRLSEPSIVGRESDSLPWHGGWLDPFLGPGPWTGGWTVILYMFHFFLAALVLGIGWWNRRRGKADNALAAGRAEGAGSRA